MSRFKPFKLGAGDVSVGPLIAGHLDMALLRGSDQDGEGNGGDCVSPAGDRGTGQPG